MPLSAFGGIGIALASIIAPRLLLLTIAIGFVQYDTPIRPSYDRSRNADSNPPATRAPLWITAYYTMWGVCDLRPHQIDWNAVSHIIHQQILPSASGRYWRFPTAFHPDDTLYFERGLGAGCGDIGVQEELIRLAHAQGRKVLLGLGGAGHGAEALRFICAQPDRIRAYVGNVLEYAQVRGYDGVDLDWEFVERPDRQGFVSLLRTLRDSLDRWKPRGLLTMAIPGWYSNRYGYDIETMNEVADQVNLMSYDMSTPWNRYSGYNAPMHQTIREYDGELDVDNGVRDWIAYGLDERKIGLGLPFYGYVWRGNRRPGERKTTDSVYQIGYGEVLKRQSIGRYYWDDSAQVPWLSGEDEHGVPYFVSFDDSASLHRKVEYAHSMRLGGVMVFELWRGFVTETGDQPLLRVVRNAAWGPPATELYPPVPAYPPHRTTFAPTTRSVALRWHPPENPAGVAVRVQLDTSRRFPKSSTLDERVRDTTLTVLDLEEGQRYYWRVRSEALSGQSPWSSIRTFRIARQPAAPAAHPTAGTGGRDRPD